MRPTEEMDLFKNRLYAARMHGEVDFSKLEVVEENGNVYIKAKTTDSKRAQQIRDFAEDQALVNMSYISFDGFVNPSTSNRYVTFIVRQ